MLVQLEQSKEDSCAEQHPTRQNGVEESSKLEHPKKLKYIGEVLVGTTNFNENCLAYFMHAKCIDENP